MDNQLMNPVISDVKNILDTARSNVAREVNNELVVAYWKIGEIIVRYEQNDNIRAAYGEQTLKQLSKALTAEFGKGFSRSNLQNMRALYLNYENCQSLTGKLTWTHYCELLSISDKNKRSFYEKEAINANWSVRELKRQINTSLYERLLLSKGNVNKEEVLNLALNGIEINEPKDIIKDPYVFEFLGVPENKPMPEAVGQLNMYLNYYENEVNDEGDNKPIGIILCTDKDAIAAEYALGGLSTNIFASKYTYYIPEKEQLIAEVEKVISQWHEKG